MHIKDRVALVTGGNHGIGEAFVRTLLAAGAAKVCVGTRDPKNAQHLLVARHRQAFLARAEAGAQKGQVGTQYLRRPHGPPGPDAAAQDERSIEHLPYCGREGEA